MNLSEQEALCLVIELFHKHEEMRQVISQLLNRYDNRTAHAEPPIKTKPFLYRVK